MTPEQIRQAVLRAIGTVAPEVDPERIDPGVPLRDQIDIDSMDFLKLVIALHDTIGVDIPERDYPKLGTLAGFVDYLSAALGTRPPVS